ncbi:MAG: alanine dehydrogenase [Pseudomonadota bacterium]
MIIGVPKEIKALEFRAGLVPASVRELVHHGHQVLTESQTGVGIGFQDHDYAQAGAKVVQTKEEVYERAELIVKVKEPQENEFHLLHEGQILFAFLHLAPDPIQAQGLIDSRCIAIAYETVTDHLGGLPLLAPMSEVAGRMAAQAGAHYLEKTQNGLGILLGGVPGVHPGRTTIIGGGVVGTNAARICLGMGSEVVIIDKSPKRLRELDILLESRVKTIVPTLETIESYVCQSDLVIGAVLVPGGSAPKLITQAMVKCMQPGSVLIDVAIDQGGCCQTSRPTTHENPIYVVDDVIHYCVTNMPGAVPRTSAFALNNATLPHILNIASKGVHQALRDDEHLRNGLNVYRGAITHQTVAQALDIPYVFAHEVLKT